MSKGSPDYTRRVILYAFDGTNFIPVAVDEDGNITSVFKGDYLGTLKTIKVDSEGRMIALVTDELDIYGNKVIVGNAELAVRLGSEKIFDRRGDVFLIESFENGVAKWNISGAGTGNAQVLTTDYVRSGGYSLKLTGGSTSLYYAKIIGYFPYPVLSKWGFEMHCSFPTQFDYIKFGFRFSTGTQYKYATIKHIDQTDTLQYYDSDGNYQTLSTDEGILSYATLFHTYKLVADFENNKYTRLILNNTTYDLSAYDLKVEDGVDEDYILIEIWLYSRSGNNDSMYIDNLIFTQNEPD